MPSRKIKTFDERIPTTSVQLPPELRDELNKARGGDSLGSEIRKRLEASFRPGLSKETRELIDQIVTLSGRFEGNWALIPEVFKAFKAGVGVLIDTHQPSGQRPKDYSEEEWARLRNQFGEDDPELSGRVSARSIRRPGHKLP